MLDQVRRLLVSFVPGIPTDPDTRMGALVSRTQYERVLEFIASAHADGARLVHGGKRPTQGVGERGYFIEPTVFADVSNQAVIALVSPASSFAVTRSDFGV